MNSIISWIGGKKALRELIYKRFPAKYGRYIEVFGGGGWVLFGKAPERNLEVYNDFNCNLTNMFEVVRDKPLAFIKELGYLPENGRYIFRLYKEVVSKERIEDKYVEEEMKRVDEFFTELQAEELKELMKIDQQQDDVKRAAAFFKLIRYSYASGCRTFGARPYDVRKAFSQIWKINERLADTIIENKDFEALIYQYDRPDAFFYCDPPYYETEGHYEVEFTKEDHVRLRDTLANIQGKFLLSYNDCPYIRELYKDFYIEATERQNNLAMRYDGASQFPEVLISNYDTSERRTVGEQINLFAYMDSSLEREGDNDDEEENF